MYSSVLYVSLLFSFGYVLCVLPLLLCIWYCVEALRMVFSCLVLVLDSLLYVLWYGFFFFFKQKTAYEMRISDWSSDVCSSDLLAEDEAGRRAALDRLLPEQRKDFTELFDIMAGLPVTIRLLDPPLHEFLPHEEEEFAEVAAAAGVAVDVLKRRAAELHEVNPMLGHRGCRLGVTYPEIYEMQARAIFEAAVDVAEKSGAAPLPEVMVPLVATRRALALMKRSEEHTSELQSLMRN